MFVLVKSFQNKYLLDEPDLGCASLLSVAHQHGIETQLIEGQIRLLPSIFEDDITEILSSLSHLDPDAYPDLVLAPDNDFEKIIQTGKALLNRFYYQQPARAFLDYRKIRNYYQLFGFWIKVVEALIESGFESHLPFINRYVDEILSNHPTLVGFSSSFRLDPISRAIRKQIKNKSDVPIVLGGCLTPFLPPNTYNTLFEKQYLDYLVVGEGELAFPRLYAAISQHQSCQSIPNVFYKTATGVDGTPPELINNLDDLPYPDFSQFDLDRYFTPEKILPVGASRGCSWHKCAFCSCETYALGKYRTLSIPRLTSLLVHLQERYQTGYFSFHDAEVPPERVEKICDAILADARLKDKVNIKLYGRFEKGFLKPGLLEKMSQAGVNTVYWGMESGSQSVLNLMRKGTRVENASQILKHAHNTGINNMVFFMWGFPGETDERRQESLDFIEDHKAYIQLILSSHFYLKELAPIGQNPERWGVVVEEDGRWKMKNGSLTSNKAAILGEKINQEILLGQTSGMYSQIFGIHLQTHSKEMIAYIFNAHHWVDPESLKNQIKASDYWHLFPVIAGSYNKYNSLKQYTFYDFSKPFTLDGYLQKKRRLTTLEERVIQLSDGTHSVLNIIKIIQNEFMDTFSSEEISQKIDTFFREIFDHNWGLAFVKPFAH